MLSSPQGYSCPELVVIKRKDGVGFCFTYRSPDNFRDAAEAFLRPIRKTISDKTSKGQTCRLDLADLPIAAAKNFLGQVFDGTLETVFLPDSVRWVAAACIQESFSSDAIPRVAVIEQGAHGMIVRSGNEFLDHQGFPRAVVIGLPCEGGGEARFYETAADFEQAGQDKPSDSCWLPQIIHRLYFQTPSVMMGRPRIRPDGVMTVECQGMGFGSGAPLAERSIGTDAKETCNGSFRKEVR